MNFLFLTRIHVHVASLLSLAALCSSFTPFASVEPFQATGGRETLAMLECARDKTTRRLREGFETQFQPEFGWVEVLGGGLEGPAANLAAGLGVTVEAGERTCVFILALDSNGEPFDKGCAQRAFFSAFLSQEEAPKISSSEGGCVEEALRVAYQPGTNLHSVCFKALVTGMYKLSVYLRYTNTFIHWFPEGHSGDLYADGAVGARLVLQHRVEVVQAASPRKSPASAGAGDGAVAGDKGGTPPPLPPPPPSGVDLPMCTLQMLREQWDAGLWRDGVRWRPTVCRLRRLSPQQARTCLSQRKEVLFVGDEQALTMFTLLHAYLNAPTRYAFLRTLEEQGQGNQCKAPAIFEQCRAKLAALPPALAAQVLHGRANSSAGWSSKVDMQGFLGTTDTPGKGAAEAVFSGQGCTGFLRTNLSTQQEPSSADHLRGLNLTYISYATGSTKMLPPWMEQEMLGHLSRTLPFQSVLYARMATDAKVFQSLSYEKQVMPSVILPELLRLASATASTSVASSRLMLLGPWAPTLREGLMEDVQVAAATSTPGLNWPRLTYLEAVAKVVLEEKGHDVLLPTLLLSARPPTDKSKGAMNTGLDAELCASAFAVLEVWLTLHC